MSGGQMFNRLGEFPKQHVAITLSNSVNIPQGLVIVYALTAGNLAIVDEFDMVIVYAVLAGDIIPVMVKRINATSSTATAIGLY